MDEATFRLTITEKTEAISEKECVRGYSVHFEMSHAPEELPRLSTLGTVSALLLEAVDQIISMLGQGGPARKLTGVGPGDSLPPLEKGLKDFLAEVTGGHFPEEIDAQAKD